MAQHTPGPWVVKAGKHGWPRGIDAPADMQTKGGVGSVVRWNGIGFPSSPAAAANARLIAAAPEMLADLKNLVETILGYEIANNLSPAPGRKYCWDSVERAVSTIAKATGSQS